MLKFINQIKMKKEKIMIGNVQNDYANKNQVAFGVLNCSVEKDITQQVIAKLAKRAENILKDQAQIPELNSEQIRALKTFPTKLTSLLEYLDKRPEAYEVVANPAYGSFKEPLINIKSPTNQTLFSLKWWNSNPSFSKSVIEQFNIAYKAVRRINREGKAASVVKLPD